MSINFVKSSGISSINSPQQNQTISNQQAKGNFNGLMVRRANSSEQSDSPMLRGSNINPAAKTSNVGAMSENLNSEMAQFTQQLTKFLETFSKFLKTLENTTGNNGLNSSSRSANANQNSNLPSEDQNLLNSPFITSEQLKNIKDPEAFFKSRNEALFPPTSAKVDNHYDGTSQPLNQKQLATPEQAQYWSNYLSKLTEQSFPVNEVEYKTGPFALNYGNDPRRQLQVGNFNVGSIMQIYANNPKEVADRMMIDQMKYYSSTIPSFLS